MRLLALLLALMWPLASQAEEIVLGLSKDEVSITATFNGSEILLFGAIKRELPLPPPETLGVILAIAGPNEPAMVRRKDRVAGVWVNTASERVDIAPSFYAIATSGPLSEVLLPVEDLQHAISWQRRIVGEGDESFLHRSDFTEAFVRIKAAEGLYQILEGSVDIEDSTLFHTRINLPSNITEGNYTARIFLTRDGRVIDEFVTDIPVFKVGLERWLYGLSQNHAALYGLLSLLVAAVAGWGASAIFSAFRR